MREGGCALAEYTPVPWFRPVSPSLVYSRAPGLELQCLRLLLHQCFPDMALAKD